MIVEWIASVGSSIAAFIAGLFPAWSPPDWLTGFGSQVQSVLVPAAGLGVWLPFALAGTVVASVVATWVVCFGIKLILRVGSHVPVFGGAG